MMAHASQLIPCMIVRTAAKTVPAYQQAAAALTAIVIIMPRAIVTRVYGLIFTTVMGVLIIAAMMYVRIVVKLNRLAQRIVTAAANAVKPMMARIIMSVELQLLVMEQN